MIVAAAAMIIWSAVDRLLNPRALEELGIGLAITILATVINGIVGVLILRTGRRHRSITLVADGKHLLTDVWTSVGVVIGVAIVAVTGWLPLDSLVAIAVAINILWTGGRLVLHSTRGLMDHAMPDDDVALITTCLRTSLADEPEVRIHGLRTRESGRERFVSMHVLVPGEWAVSRGHDVLERIEQRLHAEMPGLMVHTHLEPVDDPRSYDDAHGALAVDLRDEGE
jgi:cation diffusion facilitator family transporter